LTHDDLPADVKRYPDAAALADRLAADIAASLSQAIAQRGLASLVVSGGNSPVKLFQALAHAAARLEPRLRGARR
jgi:6-phosphogluconolactonase